MKRFTLALALSLFTVGCVAPSKTVEQMSADEYSALCTYEFDQFEKFHDASGPEVSFEPTGLAKYQLCASWQKDVITYSLLLRTHRSLETGWAFWETLIDLDSRRFPARVLQRDAQLGGWTFEKVSISLSREYFEKIAAQPAGTRLRLQGQRDQIEFLVPATEAQNFLQYVDARYKDTLSERVASNPR